VALRHRVLAITATQTNLLAVTIATTNFARSVNIVQNEREHLLYAGKAKYTSIAPDPVSGSDVDVHVRFDTDSTTCEKLVLPKDMVKYLANKFTSYLPDKDIQETVLDANPVPNIQCLQAPKIDDYLGEIFETMCKSYGAL
jgi:hypothetical protein